MSWRVSTEASGGVLTGAPWLSPRVPPVWTPVEDFVCHVKRDHRITIPCEKLVAIFIGFVQLAAVLD